MEILAGGDAVETEEVLPRLVPGLGKTEATLGCLFLIGVTATLVYPPIGIPLLIGVGLWGVLSRFINPERRAYAEYLRARDAFRKGDYAVATNHLERLETGAWGREPVRRGLAHCYYHLGRWRDATAQFGALLAPSDADRSLAAEAGRRAEEEDRRD